MSELRVLSTDSWQGTIGLAGPLSTGFDSEKGRRIPQEVRRFVTNLKQDDPGLSYRQIKERAEAKFPGVQIDKSPVANILKGGTKEMGRGEKLDFKEQTDFREHRSMLLASLEGLRGIGPLAIHDRDLATWWSRTDTPSWPIPKGRAWRKADGTFRITLAAEKVEVERLESPER